MEQIFTRLFPDFDRMYKGISELQWEIHSRMAGLQRLKNVFSESVAEYQNKRQRLIVKEIEKNGLTYCFRCNSFHKEKEGHLVCIVESSYYEHGYENSCYGYSTSTKVYIACEGCYEKMVVKSGWKGEYDALANGQASFDMYDLEIDDSGVFVCPWYNDGKPVVLTEHLCDAMKNVPGHKLELLAQQLLLPKDVRLENDHRVTWVDWPDE